MKKQLSIEDLKVFNLANSIGQNIAVTMQEGH